MGFVPAEASYSFHPSVSALDIVLCGSYVLKELRVFERSLRHHLQIHSSLNRELPTIFLQFSNDECQRIYILPNRTPINVPVLRFLANLLVYFDNLVAWNNYSKPHQRLEYRHEYEFYRYKFLQFADLHLFQSELQHNSNKFLPYGK